jgi:RNA polymerase sigma-70 factor, ECF subfamily
LTGPENAPPEKGPSSGDSFTSIVDAYWTTVYRFLHRMSGDTHDAEDLTQETFLRALNRLDSFRPGTCLRVWLLKIAANAYVDVHRRRQRVEFKALEHEPAASLPGPDHHLELGEQAALLRAGLEGLPEMTRMVFHLRAAEDLSFRDIAELVGTTEQGARWHMRQARVKLLAQLAEKP